MEGPLVDVTNTLHGYYTCTGAMMRRSIDKSTMEQLWTAWSMDDTNLIRTGMIKANKQKHNIHKSKLYGTKQPLLPMTFCTLGT